MIRIIISSRRLIIKTQKAIITILLFIICAHTSFAGYFTEIDTLSPVSSANSKNSSLNEDIFNLTPEIYSKEFLRDLFSKKKVLKSLKDGSFMILDLNKFKQFTKAPSFYQLAANELEKRGILEKTQKNGEIYTYKINIKNIHKYFVKSRHISEKEILGKILLSDEESFFITLKEVLSKKKYPKIDIVFLCEIILMKFKSENKFDKIKINDLTSYLNNVISGLTTVFADGALFLGHAIFFKKINSDYFENISDASDASIPALYYENKWLASSEEIVNRPERLVYLFKTFDNMFEFDPSNNLEMIADLFITNFFASTMELALWPDHDNIAKLNSIEILQKSISYLKTIIVMQLKWFDFIGKIKNNKHLDSVDEIKLATLIKVLENEISISIAYGVEKFSYRTILLQHIKDIARAISKSS